ncbi:MAG: hypothetical protein EBY28_14080 [Betaproteobacteria bacterium]|nr:hypothetical protein [Betaproteobacteria bacterium]
MSIDSFKSVHDRCIEVGECWIWVGRLNPANYPMASHQGVNVLVRRRVFEMTKDWVPDGRGTVVAATCNERACCNPEHLRAASRSSVFKAAAKRVNQQATYGRRLAAKVNSPGGVKLSLAIAREIRADERNCVQIARTLGVSASAVQKIRQGKIWRETANGASVFGWRPAA